LRPSETGCAAGRRESLPCAKGGTLKTKNVNTSAAEIHTEAAAGHFFAAQGFFLRGPLLGEKLEVLSKKLGTAFKDGAASERDRYFQALSALGEFLQGFNGTNDYAFRLADLAFALRDLDKGSGTWMNIAETYQTPLQYVTSSSRPHTKHFERLRRLR
jgi:hypothetical protein